MHTLTSLLLLLSLPTLFIAVSLSPNVLLRVQQFLPFQSNVGLTLAPVPEIYCYGSITTLDDNDALDGQNTVRCLAVNPDGTFGAVFQPPPGIEPSDMGWHLDLSAHAIPGLWDGHAHLLQYGEMLESVLLYGAASIEEVNTRISKHHAQNPSQGTRTAWIKGMGWDQAPFPNGMPSATDLPPDLYVILTRVDFHCIWVSPAVLALLPSPFPPSPPGGHIPSPGVFCDAAVDLILPFLPPPTEEDKTRHLASAQTSLHSFGIVGVHDAGVTQPDRELYSRLADTATLTLRIYAMVECRRRNTFCPAESWKVEREDGMLTVAAVKLFADGALGSWGAALIEPYSDAPASNGTMLITPEELVIVTQNWRDAGWTVCIHAIGDAANRAALDAIEAAGASRAGYRIEHAQIVAPEDQVRMGRLRVTPSIQPTHATSDMYYAEARLGEKRLRERAYRMKSLLPMKPVLGSDFPVEPPSVLRGIYAAVTRRNPATGKGRDGGEEGWYQEETLSLREALGGFTRNVARAAGMGGKTGAVREGLWADWVVLGNRIDKGGSVEWLREEEAVRETWVAGKRVFVRET